MSLAAVGLMVLSYTQYSRGKVVLYLMRRSTWKTAP